MLRSRGGGVREGGGQGGDSSENQQRQGRQRREQRGKVRWGHIGAPGGGDRCIIPVLRKQRQ